jgi:LysR family glycine cleavage system transcriptional activator
VDVSVSFATLWLLPRLDDFTDRHPDIDVRVITRSDSAAPAQDADVVVGFGYPDLDRGDIVVVPEALVVICSPHYDAQPDDGTQRGLGTERLLGLDAPTHEDDWRRILGTDTPQITHRYSSYTVYLQAVLEGHGIGLGWRPLIDQHLRDGRLLQVGHWNLATDRSYFLESSRRANPLTSQFVDWLTANQK